MKPTTHPPPPGELLAWRCVTDDGHVVIVRARMAFDARREAYRRFRQRGIVVDELDILVQLHDDPHEGRNGKRVHTLAKDFEIIGSRS